MPKQAQLIAQLGLLDKGPIIKKLVFINHWDLEPLVLLNDCLKVGLSESIRFG